MMNVKNLMARGDRNDSGLSTTQVALVVSLLMLVLLGMILIGALMFLRSMRKARRQAEANAQLPLYEKRQSNHNRLTITAMPYKGRESVVVYSEKEQLMRSAPDSPSSPVPEIRITFPDEVDESGKRQSGRVVVVRVGDHSVGLEPVQEDLPPYQRDASDRFDSLDLDRIGGLKEKDSKYYS
jgi:cbb3-type cytochrome oxidase subunit 3